MSGKYTNFFLFNLPYSMAILQSRIYYTKGWQSERRGFCELTNFKYLEGFWKSLHYFALDFIYSCGILLYTKYKPATFDNNTTLGWFKVNLDCGNIAYNLLIYLPTWPVNLLQLFSCLDREKWVLICWLTIQRTRYFSLQFLHLMPTGNWTFLVLSCSTV